MELYNSTKVILNNYKDATTTFEHNLEVVKDYTQKLEDSRDRMNKLQQKAQTLVVEQINNYLDSVVDYPIKLESIHKAGWDFTHITKHRCITAKGAGIEYNFKLKSIRLEILIEIAKQLK